jgi:hypothetical protein
MSIQLMHQRNRRNDMPLIDNLLTRAGLPGVLPTNEAAAAINRAPQTLRKWACLENGPIRPIRINGRLAWRVSDLKSLLNGGASSANTSRHLETAKALERGNAQSLLVHQLSNRIVRQSGLAIKWFSPPRA